MVIYMFLFQGKSPYSSFRQEKLLFSIQKKQSTVTSVIANYLYFVQAKSLTLDQQSKLISIIDQTARPEISIPPHGIIITPRFGTISPWSSKATDILKVCGFSSLRVERGVLFQFSLQRQEKLNLSALLPLIHDKMIETCCLTESDLANVFQQGEPTPNESVPLLTHGIEALKEVNKNLGLALSEQEIVYLIHYYERLGRNPTFAELMMFAQINSEHCRHKIFNAKWTVDGKVEDKSLFGMIKNTYACSGHNVLSAYKDNGAIIKGHSMHSLLIDPKTGSYHYCWEPTHIVIKVETHNHPTAISPFEGAATGAGGEIRDEGATGIGAKPKAGLTGFAVSNLHIPQLPQPWEQRPFVCQNMASSLDIILQGPIGAASFNNEFGRPNLCGFFRTFEMLEASSSNEIGLRGYHKPIMIAGGMGQIRPMAVKKSSLPDGAKLIVLGGPAMLIGLGGGAASSLYSGGSHKELDFASVQRSNPEMQRRCQEVINHCFLLGQENPIISIHDVGAGGLSNAFSELVHDSKKGGIFNLRAIPSADTHLNAMQIWCNEAQERYVLAISDQHLAIFKQIAHRERCPYAIVGEVTSIPRVLVKDPYFNESPVDLPLSLLFGEGSKRHCHLNRQAKQSSPEITVTLALKELIERVLQLPTVSDKKFLITIGDRTVTGLVARDQMIGPWQVPVADVGVTASGYQDCSGEAMAMGERTPLALINARAAAAMAVGEAITNIVASDVRQLSDIKLSANWMGAFGYKQEAENLFEAVEEVGMNLCPALGICIPVGKDSLSMEVKWQEANVNYQVVAPLSLVISAFAPVKDITRTLTPELVKDPETELLLLDLGLGQNRLGASCLAQVTRQLGDSVPDVNKPVLLLQFFNAIRALRDRSLILAYHDRSDGGLLVTLSEMMFASRVGLTLDIHSLPGDAVDSLFNEELGAVIQYFSKDKLLVADILRQQGLTEAAFPIGHLNAEDQLIIKNGSALLYKASRVYLHRLWSKTSYHLQALRDNPECALQEYNALLDQTDPGLHAKLTFDLPRTPPAVVGTRPKVAILREQGVNGHMEMAAAFDRAGLMAIDVHMTDILSDRINLKEFQGLVACGGFSYGDVLGAGRGWANSILYNEKAREQFITFFHQPSVFALGVCNGCQMLSHLKALIPGAEHWPTFVRNTSEQFEARLSLVRINSSPSLFFAGMEGSILPIAVSHGEGRAFFEHASDALSLVNANLVPLQYVNNYDEVTQDYPANPNGSPLGIASVSNRDGRFTLMMPHAERVFRNVQFSWRPSHWQAENSPWFQLFLNARNWLK
jgi:phosphoribosylformylglycinamidine synthase